jgi:hypothetical protein
MRCTVRAPIKENIMKHDHKCLCAKCVILRETPEQAVARIAAENAEHFTNRSTAEQPKERAMNRAIPNGYEIALRAAVGARHSAADQSHLDSAAVHLHAAGANCPPMTEDGTEKAASAFLLRASEAHPPRGWRVLRTNDEVVADLGRDHTPPNPYAAVEMRTAELADAMDPHVDPRYDPYGVAPDPYLHALQLRKVLAQEAH